MAKQKTAANLSKAIDLDGKLSGALPAGYTTLFSNLKARVHGAQLRAAVSVNRELILLYWDIGKIIVESQKTKGYGKQVVERLADDLQKEFPGMAGLSSLDLWRMRAFYSAYRNPVEILSQAVTESASAPPKPTTSLPWGHNIVLLHKLESNGPRLWYAHKTIEYGWSRAVLTHHIEMQLHKREGKAVTNFKRTLPPPQSDLAEQTLKDPYNFDFLTNFYLSAVHDQLRHADDKPSIGLLLCKERDYMTVEYALRDLKKPIGVAPWQTKLVEYLPKNLKGSLPTVAEIEAELDDARTK